MIRLTSGLNKLTAYLTTGIFICFLAFNTVAFTFPSQSQYEADHAVLEKAPVERLILRESGCEGMGSFFSTKIWTERHATALDYQLLITETVHRSILVLNQSQRNVFYVFVSSLAP